MGEPPKQKLPEKGADPTRSLPIAEQAVIKELRNFSGSNFISFQVGGGHVTHLDTRDLELSSPGLHWKPDIAPTPEPWELPPLLPPPVIWQPPV